MQRLINNAPTDWEDRLGDSLLAYRNSVSTTTGHTPFYIMYGRDSRIPLRRKLQTQHANVFSNRLDDLATVTSRHYNRERLAKKANANDIAIGDSVVIRAEERTTFTLRWDPRWEVTRTRGPVIWVRHQQTGANQRVLMGKMPLAFYPMQIVGADLIGPLPKSTKGNRYIQ